MYVMNRPVLGEAFQMTAMNMADNHDNWPGWFKEAWGQHVWEQADKGTRWRVRTLEGILAVSENDWIMYGTAHELRPVKPDIFKRKYFVLPDGELPWGPERKYEVIHYTTFDAELHPGGPPPTIVADGGGMSLMTIRDSDDEYGHYFHIEAMNRSGMARIVSATMSGFLSRVKERLTKKAPEGDS